MVSFPPRRGTDLDSAAHAGATTHCWQLLIIGDETTGGQQLLFIQFATCLFSRPHPSSQEASCGYTHAIARANRNQSGPDPLLVRTQISWLRGCYLLQSGIMDG